jgi:hypothetical protein
MPVSPFETFEHLTESICSYLETAYKISDQAVFAERGWLLREDGCAPLAPAVAQDPFIESTPAFPAAQYLAALVNNIGQLPPDLEKLTAFGLPVRDFPLYDHQVEAIERSYSDTPNLVVATGTGSGKTENLLLPIFADVLREALALPWPAPIRAAQPGTYNSAQQQWSHCRRHERRHAAARAIILYPMNTLVNDQLQRLRCVLADPASEASQLATLNGNLIYFGMYTGDTEPTGHWSRPAARDRWNRNVQGIATAWSGLSPEYQKMKPFVSDSVLVAGGGQSVDPGPRSAFGSFVRSFSRNRGAVIGLVILTILVTLARTQSEQGTISKMTLASLYGTWRARGLNPLHACRDLLKSPDH